jgi:hypothetical protein
MMLIMPALANHRHERFAQLIALSSSPRSAYIECGYKDSITSRPNASKLKHSAPVKQRISELVEQWGEDCKIQLSWIQHSLLAIAEGGSLSRTVKGPKGAIEECDRLGAFTALLRSLGVTDVSVTAIANAEANLDLGARLDRAIARTRENRAKPDQSGMIGFLEAAQDANLGNDDKAAIAAWSDLVVDEGIEMTDDDLRDAAGALNVGKAERLVATSHVGTNGGVPDTTQKTESHQAPQADITPSSTLTDERVSSAAERPEKASLPMRF